MNFNSTSILSLNKDSFDNSGAFIKIINNLPLHSIKKREIVTENKIISRVTTSNNLVVNSSNYSNGWFGVILKILRPLFSFRYTSQPHKRWFR